MQRGLSFFAHSDNVRLWCGAKATHAIQAIVSPTQFLSTSNKSYTRRRFPWARSHRPVDEPDRVDLLRERLTCLRVIFTLQSTEIVAKKFCDEPVRESGGTGRRTRLRI